MSKQRESLRSDGKVLVNIRMDSSAVQRRTTRKLKLYRENYYSNHDFSQYRYDYLRKTIEYLHRFGDVYLVRLPVGSEMSELEREFIPDFDDKMRVLCSQFDIPYINLFDRSGQFRTIDGSHLFYDSAVETSKIISHQIAAFRDSDNL